MPCGRPLPPGNRTGGGNCQLERKITRGKSQSNLFLSPCRMMTRLPPHLLAGPRKQRRRSWRKKGEDQFGFTSRWQHQLTSRDVTCTCMRVHACTCVHVHACAHVRVRACMYGRARTCVYVRVRRYMYMHVRMCIYMHVHICMYLCAHA